MVLKVRLFLDADGSLRDDANDDAVFGLMVDAAARIVGL